MSILDCIGQEPAIDRLQRARRSQRLPHSYIFYGPEGVGKSLLARRWAQLLLCRKPIRRTLTPGRDKSSTHLTEIDDTCDQCEDCHLVQAETHPDLHIISKELSGYTSQQRERQVIALPIDVIREFVIEPSGTYPSRHQARVFIIDQAEAMNTPAQNALLKTLEEPPQGTFLILITSHIELLLPTVRSRCQLVRFAALAKDFVTEKLKTAGIDDPQANYWADFSGGRLGVALELAQSKIYEAKCELVNQLAQLSYETALSLAQWLIEQAKTYSAEYLKNRPDRSAADALRTIQLYLLEIIAHAFNTAMQIGITPTSPPRFSIPPDQPIPLAKLAEKYDTYACSKIIHAAWQAQRQMHANANPTLIFEAFLLKCVNYALVGADL